MKLRNEATRSRPSSRPRRTRIARMRQRGKAARREHNAAVAYAVAAETSSPKSRGSSRDLTDQIHVGGRARSWPRRQRSRRPPRL